MKKDKVTYKLEDLKKRKGKNTPINTYVGQFEHEFNKRWTEDQIKGLADEMLNWFKADDKENYWLKDFAIEKYLSPQILSDFQTNEYFKYIYDLCLLIQESRLMKKGMSKDVNGAMPIFALKQLGWKDKTETDITVTTKDELEERMKSVFGA